jgi:hypothetical protein
MRIVGRAVVAGAVLLTVLGGATAQARWGEGKVDTWVSAGTLTAGRGDVSSDPSTLSLHVSSHGSREVVWTIKNLGGQPETHSLVFHGCASGDGFGFRYYVPSGREVSWKVTHNGFAFASVPAHETRQLKIVVSAKASYARRTCTLEGDGLSGVDRVRLALSS